MLPGWKFGPCFVLFLIGVALQCWLDSTVQKSESVTGISPLFLNFLPVQVTTEHWVVFPVLYNRFSLVICFIHHISIIRHIIAIHRIHPYLSIHPMPSFPLGIHIFKFQQHLIHIQKKKENTVKGIFSGEYNTECSLYFTCIQLLTLNPELHDHQAQVSWLHGQSQVESPYLPLKPSISSQ